MIRRRAYWTPLSDREVRRMIETLDNDELDRVILAAQLLRRQRAQRDRVTGTVGNVVDEPAIAADTRTR